jgi:tetratricopeptide (TPR) repeat protein
VIKQVAVLCMVLTVACGPRGESLSPGRDLRPVAFPDFSQMEEPARRQMQARQSSLSAKLANARTPAPELAEEYGEMGKLLMAATHLEAAESCYLNAQALAPADPRWPYYLGHVYRVRGPLAQAVASFEQALRLQPTDVAALIWLGEVHLAEGRPEAAAPLFARALELRPDSAAAFFGAGRAALASRDFAGAARNLEQALAREPRGTAAHYPLALAYRGLGDVARAEEHLKIQGKDEPRPADPLMRDIELLLESPEAYNVRGGQALDAGDWPAAADYFRKGLTIAPDDLSLRHRLGTALAQSGDARGAAEQFEEVIRRSPSHARAHFSLGVILNEAGLHEEAITRFSTALKHEPGYTQARVQLAGVLARSGRPGEAVVEYARALDADPTLAEAAYGRGMALVRLRRYRDARDQFADGTVRFPGDPLFKLALARLLAAAPDDQVRDGRRAMALVDELMKGQQSIELAETAAMGLAEVGQYEQAATVQRDVLSAARGAGLEAVVRRVSENLQRYERREPSRRPFADDELP